MKQEDKPMKGSRKQVCESRKEMKGSPGHNGDPSQQTSQARSRGHVRPGQLRGPEVCPKPPPEWLLMPLARGAFCVRLETGSGAAVFSKLPQQVPAQSCHSSHDVPWVSQAPGLLLWLLWTSGKF